MIAPTEGSLVLNLSGEVGGRIVTNKQGEMTVETDVVEESSSGGGVLIVDTIMDTESDDPTPTGINKSFNEISDALESGTFVMFRFVSESEEDGVSEYSAQFNPVSEIQATVSEGEAEYIVVAGNIPFVSTDPDVNMEYYSGSDEGGSSSPSL